jgi:hypothetical protein
VAVLADGARSADGIIAHGLAGPAGSLHNDTMIRWEGLRPRTRLLSGAFTTAWKSFGNEAERRRT